MAKKNNGHYETRKGKKVWITKGYKKKEKDTSFTGTIADTMAKETPFPTKEIRQEIEKAFAPYYDQLVFDATGDYKTARERMDADLLLAKQRGDEDKVTFLTRLSDQLDLDKDRIGEDYTVAKDRMEVNRQYFLDQLAQQKGYNDADYWAEVERQGTERNRFLEDIATQQGYNSTDYQNALGRAQQEQANFLQDIATTRGYQSEDFNKAMALQQDERANLLEDVARNKDYNSKDYTTVMDRLKEADQIFKSRDAEQFTKAVKATKEQIKRQGILNSGVAAQEYQEQEKQHQYNIDDYDRALKQQTDDLSTQYERNQAALDLQQGRGTESIDRNIENLQTEYARATAAGNTEEARGLQDRINNLTDMKTTYERQNISLEEQKKRGTQDYDLALQKLAVAKQRADTATADQKAQYEQEYQNQLADMSTQYGRSTTDLTTGAEQKKQDFITNWTRQYGTEGDAATNYARQAEDMQKAYEKAQKEIEQQRQAATGTELANQYQNYQQYGETYPYTTYRAPKIDANVYRGVSGTGTLGVQNYQDILDQYNQPVENQTT